MTFDKRFQKYKFKKKEIEQFKNKKILITGASGFIGFSLYLFFLNLNHNHNLNIKFFLVSRTNSFLKKINKNLNTKHININIVDFNKIKIKVDFIFHLASNVEHRPSKKVISESLNTVINGTNSIVNYCNKNNVKKLIYFSSAAIYSDKKNILNKKIDENHEMFFDINDDVNYYALHKKIAEDIITNNLNKERYYIVRPFTVVGPRMKLNHSFVFGNFIKHLIDKNDFIIKGNGLSKRSFLHVDDLSFFTVKLTLNGKNSIYNLGSKEIINIKKLAKIFCLFSKTNLNKNLKVEILNNIKNSRRNSYKPDLDLFFNEFKLNEKFSITEKILDTYSWFTNYD